MESPFIFKFFGMSFSATVLLASSASVLIIFATLLVLSRHISVVPKRPQAALEMLVSFTNGIVDSSMPKAVGSQYYLLSLVLFLFLAINNMLGLMTIISYKDFSFWGSPTSSAIVCLGLSVMVILFSHYQSVEKFGAKAYVKNNYLSPMPLMLPINLIEEFTNTLTLGLRLYGNIYAGEILLGLIAMLATSHGLVSGIFAVPLAMIWIAFSVFIGMIQAFVFTTLSMVYISHKVIVEE